ncbi:MAG TPA: hypothetical protein PLH46_04805 [Caldisericia bacterium]|nr:hypothetical protein [Caldisericia bacterium]
MILKKIKTEHTDKKTGMVLKRITTSKWETHNHKIAVNNSLFNIEKSRVENKKPVLHAHFQIHHIFYNKKKRIWNFDRIAESKAHASRIGRLYLPFQQRNTTQWNNLTFQEAEEDFQDLVNRGLTFVPYSIPLDADLETWKNRKADALTLLTPSQTLVPIFCTKHQRDYFGDVFNYEFEKSKLIAVQCYGLNDANTLLNLMKIKLRNQTLQRGDEAPLLIGLNHEKVLRSLSCVSGNFAYSCYGFDILSCRQMNMENMPTDVIRKMISKKIEEIMKYDRVLGGFNHSAEQEFWDGINVTRAFLENVDVTQGLSPYQAIQWANHGEQQKDFDVLNDYILKTACDENALLNFINNEKEKWAVFYKTKIIPTI